MRSKKLIFTLLLSLSLNLQAQNLTLQAYGKDTIETQQINRLGYQKNHPSLNSIKATTQTLLSKLIKSGFINAQHHPLTQLNDSVFEVRFSLHQKFNTLKIYYPPHAFPSRTLQRLNLEHTSTYISIPFTQAEKVLHKLNNAIANQGHPFNNLRLTAVKPIAKDVLAAQLIINNTHLRTLDSIILKGYKKFPRAFIQHYADIKTGRVFNKTSIHKKTEQLKNLEFVELIRQPEVLFTERKTALYLYLKRQSSNRFEGFLGFSTNEDTHKLQLNGNISIKLTNNLNYGETLALNYKTNAAKQRAFNAFLDLPYVLSTPFGVFLNLSLYKQDSTYTTNSQAVNLTYQINPKLKVLAGYKVVTSNDLSDGSSPIVGQVYEDYQSGFLTLGSTFVDRSAGNLLFPIKTQLKLTIGLGQRTRENKTAAQQWIQFSGQHRFKINRRNSIYVANKTAKLFSKNYLNNELYRFGGIHSIRGFKENSLRASFYSSFQTEYRLRLSRNLYIHSIIDYAYLKNLYQHQSTNLYGIGFGLGLMTKAGRLKVAFANGKTDGQSFKFANTKVHLSLTAVF